MKKIIITICAFLTSTISIAQTLNFTSSISNANTADNFKGGYTFAYASSGTPWYGSLISFGGFNNNYDTQLNANYFGQNLSFRSRNGDNNTWNSWQELATKSTNNFVGTQTIMGNVGIGKNNPMAALDVSGEIISTGDITGSDIVSSGTNSWIFHTPDDQRRTLHIAPRLGNGEFDWAKQTIFNNNGNIAVSGKIEAIEVKVTQSPTADFVFEENYSLPKLEDIEKHIKANKHLPEIASAKQMEKEGVNVGEFQIKLLQKIEELTLYTIEQNKQIKNQSEKIKSLESENQQIKTLLERVEKLEKSAIQRIKLIH